MISYRFPHFSLVLGRFLRGCLRFADGAGVEPRNGVCIQTDEFCFQMMNFALKMVKSAFQMMNRSMDADSSGGVDLEEFSGTFLYMNEDSSIENQDSSPENQDSSL